MLSGNLQDDFFPVRFTLYSHGSSGQFFTLARIVDVGQCDLEGIIRNLELGLHTAVGIAFVDFQNAGAVSFNQFQAILLYR